MEILVAILKIGSSFAPFFLAFYPPSPLTRRPFGRLCFAQPQSIHFPRSTEATFSTSLLAGLPILPKSFLLLIKPLLLIAAPFASLSFGRPPAPLRSADRT